MGGPSFNSAVYLRKYDEDLTIRVLELNEEKNLPIQEVPEEGEDAMGIEEKDSEEIVEVSEGSASME